ncbi:hypothetical protein Pmgp_03408 [Pelotomaculum propionicicum]|uniref:Uncharacterized protein n=1 Tax=Pelotomaculum propionicicum TaxID=258475 RepID=A0A4Y7RJV9_9FIRM|nr:hypothetical protein Pmgp_03408 [Pelotomaculum propionicicum]
MEKFVNWGLFAKLPEPVGGKCYKWILFILVSILQVQQTLGLAESAQWQMVLIYPSRQKNSPWLT